ncbi:hypothetical protein CVV43_04490 [Candidatus Saccharibacteria bacterium HGW-Saccharibacteria-1]|nr:MAG: hypothetical protein CVV43_04490 [Candidatus Saccharibacteria bacterium HGW-Saccharibacteria-1]
MFAIQKSKNRQSSRNQIAIKGVRNNILILPHDQYRAILEVTPVNFELRSEEEQDAIIDTYESFLNSVGSRFQILIRTREIDMDKYLEDLRQQLDGEIELIYKQQLENYDEFIRSLIQTNKILTRHFYIIVPHSNSNKVDFDLVREQLNLTLDIIAKGMTRLGTHSRQLTNIEILDLFYSFYSPAQSKIQPLRDKAFQLIHSTLVKGGN